MISSFIWSTEGTQLKWKSGEKFSSYLQSRNISLSILDSLDELEKQVVGEIQGGQIFYEFKDNKGNILQTLIPISDTLEIKLSKDTKSDKYKFSIVPIDTEDNQANNTFTSEPLTPKSTIQIIAKHKGVYTLSTGNKLSAQELSLLREVANMYSNIDGVDKLLLNFKIQKDEVENLYFLIPNSYGGTYIKFYIVVNAKKSWLRFKLRYYSDTWLFINSFKIVADNFKWQSPILDFQRDNDSKIWEWLDIKATNQFVKIGKNILKSKKSIIRLYGRQYYDDFEVDQDQKQAIANTFKLYELINSTKK